MQQIQLNIIPFKPIVSVLSVGLYKDKLEGYASLYKGEYPKILWEQHEEELREISHLYCDFASTENADYTAEVNINESTNFGLHYFRFLIYNYFQDKVDIIFPNFVNDVEIWMHDKTKSTAKYKQYNKYTLKIQYARLSDGFELVVAYDGTSKIYTKSVQDLGSFDTEKLNWVNCNGKLYRWAIMPPELKQDLDQIFPVLSNTLKPMFGISFDIPTFENRYPKYLQFINTFYESWLNNVDFKKIIPLSEEGFWKVEEDKILRTKLNSNELLFGKNTLSISPLEGMKKYGPYKKSPHNNVKFFFIYHPEDKAKAVSNIYSYFNKGFFKLNDEGGEYRAFPDIYTYIKQPLLLDIASNIEIKDKNNIVEEVETAIKNAVHNPGTRYVAIYISPIAKTEENEALLNVYYRVKEILINYGISSQVIYNQNLLKSDFNYFLPNIEIALLAKLGGIPWRLNCSSTDELIVGVGAFYSYADKTKYVGSAFCFNNEGIFEGFDCFGADETDMLAGSIRNAVTTYVETKKQAKRLIIHFYKKMSEQELEPILHVLHHLELDIPVIVVTINKTESKELLAFDLKNTNLMPFSGTILQVGRRDYLLCNNTRYKYNSVVKPKEYHFPIKLNISCTKPGVLDDIAVVKDLMDQVYQFSRMYWKSVSQQSLPVTTLYPEMVAKMYPHFEHDKLPDFGKENLWFL